MIFEIFAIKLFDAKHDGNLFIFHLLGGWSFTSFLIASCLMVLNVICSMTGFVPKNSIKNTGDLMDRLGKFTMSNGKTMVFFDVTNLFTSIPVDESVLFVRNLRESRKAVHSKILDIVL